VLGLFRLLVSRTTALALMLAMASILALASLVPPRDLARDRVEEARRIRPVAVFLVEMLRPEEVSRSPAFLGLAGLVFFSTAWSVGERLRAEFRRRRRQVEPGLERFRARRSLDLVASPGAVADALRAILARTGYLVEAPALEGGRVVASRGVVGFAGSIVFHVGILVTMVAVGVSAQTRFNAEVLLVEGNAQPLVPGVIVGATRPELARGLAGTSLRIRDFQAEYQGGFGHADFAALFEILGPDGARRAEVVRVNQPVEVDGFQFTLYRYGFAPGLHVQGDGRALANGLAILRVIPPGTEDGLPLADGSELRLSLYPDFVRHGPVRTSRSMVPVAPLLAVRHLVAGRETAAGEVRLGETARLGALAVSFPELRYWADFQMGRDQGLPWFAIGTALVAVGLGLRFLFDPQTLRFDLSPTPGGVRVDLVASARYFPALNDERAGRLAGALAARLAPGRAEVA